MVQRKDTRTQDPLNWDPAGEALQEHELQTFSADDSIYATTLMYTMQHSSEFSPKTTK